MPRGRPRKIMAGDQLSVATKEQQRVPELKQQISTVMIQPKFVNRLTELDELYRQRKIVCRNIIDDSRIKPSNRFYRFVMEAVKNGYDSDVAAEYAIRRLESRKEFIAGNCGKIEWNKML